MLAYPAHIKDGAEPAPAAAARGISGRRVVVRCDGVDCPFCERLNAGELVAENDLAAAFFDAYPLNPGHCLIVPRRHEASYVALSPDEQASVWALFAAARQAIEERYKPEGYNVGINIGEAAGQTIAHAHVHVIPRYLGDIQDPRGGVRWVLPAKAAYWEGR